MSAAFTPAAEHWFAVVGLVGLFVLMAAWTVRQVLRWSSEAVDRMVAEALESLTADDLDDDWDQHVAEALALAETPIYADLAAEKLRAELNNPAAVALWLSGGAR